jgi:hypothetical protein
VRTIVVENIDGHAKLGTREMIFGDYLSHGFSSTTDEKSLKDKEVE